MRAGELRHRIVIQQNTPTRDAFNAEVESWASWATVWAKIETVSGSEYIEQQAAGATVTHQVTVRHRAGIVPTMRVVFESRTFEITAVLEDNLNRATRLMCSEVV